MGLNYVREGFRAFSQDLILPYICSNAFGRLPLLYFLAMRSGQTTKDSMTLGRPGMATILSGVPLSKARQEKVRGSVVKVDIHTATSDDTKEMGIGDTRPVVTTSQDQNFGQAEFRKSRLITPIKVRHAAIKEAMQEKNANRSVQNVVRKATEEALGVHQSAQATRLWFGGVINPTDSVDYTFNQNEAKWKRYLGIVAQINTDNVCGRVNRANLPSGAAWKGKRVTTAFAPDIFELIDEANIGQSCADSGVGDGGVTLVLCTKLQFRKYKRQARAQGQKYWADGVPEMAQLGFKREVIQVDNCYVTYDPLCPAGYAAALNLGTWTFATDEDNARVTEFASMCDNGQSGGEEADKADVITEGTLIGWSPYANCLFTAIQES